LIDRFAEVSFNAMLVRALILATALYASWLAMMAVHELGHVLHAWISGGVVRAVHVPLAGFSITEFDCNPHPHFVAWGGPIWGTLLPLAVWGVFRALRLQFLRAAQFFAGFCLIANGLYLGVGWTTRAGDAGDLVRHGTPVCGLVAFGMIATGAGLGLWHGLGRFARPEVRPTHP
jgi:hypothetical protein